MSCSADAVEPLRITKLEAARRQLREAIRMFFEGRDPISIHTVTAAARTLLVDLVRPGGGESILENSPMVRPGKRREWIDIVRRAQNFFKHADREPDPSAYIEFRQEATQLMLLDAVFLYRKLTGRRLREGEVFQLWFAMKNPAFFILDQQVKNLLNNAAGRGDRFGLREFQMICDEVVSGDDID